MQNLPLIILIALLFFIVSVVIFAISIIARTGLIKSVDRIEQEQDTHLRSAFNFGINNFWKFLGLTLLIAVCIFATVIIFVSPALLSLLLLKFNKLYLSLTILLVVIAIIILIPASILWGIQYELASRYLLLKHLSIKNSFRLGFKLIFTKFKQVGLTWLILLGIGIGFNIVLLLIMILFLLPIIGIGITGYLSAKMTGVLVLVIPLILLVLIILKFLSGIFQAFNSSVWTITFREIV
ncbi:MAG: hypothetical protein M1371_01185 [Actinobacteria bacterium]|nr:hypothetical protein [Actinomycetota bacterium]